MYWLISDFFFFFKCIKFYLTQDDWQLWQLLAAHTHIYLIIAWKINDVNLTVRAGCIWNGKKKNVVKV